jgi:hypothetical protein
MKQKSGAAGIGRPRVVVAVGASVDGRITLRRGSRLVDKEVGRIWGRCGRQAHREEPTPVHLWTCIRCQAVLEGSGSWVADSAGPLIRAPHRLRRTNGSALHRLSAAGGRREAGREVVHGRRQSRPGALGQDEWVAGSTPWCW